MPVAVQDHHLAMGDELIQKQKAHRGGAGGLGSPLDPPGGAAAGPSPDLYDVFEQEGQDLRIQKMILLPNIDRKVCG